jgi:2-polyprenyl-3-methyl-5-hydroxy-6-metoxy-1,4-benzoquinol methylase
MNIIVKSDQVKMAMNDYFSGQSDVKLIVNNNYGQPENYPIEYFFRSKYDMPEIENFAINLCTGRIIDIGSGVGPHSLFLQRLGMDVTAIDNSPVMTSILLKQGIRKVICDNVFNFQCRGYDTAMLLMNGIGIVGTISMFQTFLKKMEEVIQHDGQLLFDSTDISYMYES